MSQTAIRGKQLRLSAKGDEMNQRSETLSQPELEAHKRREARERKPVREWTAEERPRHSARRARLSATKPRLASWTNGTCATQETDYCLLTSIMLSSTIRSTSLLYGSIPALVGSSSTTISNVLSA